MFPHKSFYSSTIKVYFEKDSSLLIIYIHDKYSWMLCIINANYVWKGIRKHSVCKEIFRLNEQFLVSFVSATKFKGLLI